MSEKQLEQGKGVRPVAEAARWRTSSRKATSQNETEEREAEAERETGDACGKETDGEPKYERYSRTTRDKLQVIYKMITTNECNFSLANEIEFWAGSKPLRSDFILTVIK